MEVERLQGEVDSHWWTIDQWFLQKILLLIADCWMLMLKSADAQICWCWNLLMLLMLLMLIAGEANGGWGSKDCVASTSRLSKKFNQQVFPWKNILCNPTQDKKKWKVFSSTIGPTIGSQCLAVLSVSKFPTSLSWRWYTPNNHNHWSSLLLGTAQNISQD